MKNKQIRKKIVIGMMVIALQPIYYMGGGILLSNNRYGTSQTVSAATQAEHAKALTQVSTKALNKASTKASAKASNENYYTFFAPDDTQLYYYNEILATEVEKQVYTAIVDEVRSKIDNIDENNKIFTIPISFEQTFSSMGLSNQTLNHIVHAIRSDHPEWYWMSKEAEIGSDGKSLNVIGSAQFSSKITRTDIESQLMTKVQEFKSTYIVSGDDVYDKVLKIHDYIIKNTYSSRTATNASNIVGVLLDQSGSSESYAKASQLFFNYFNIENVYVTGTNVKTDERHAWNQVYIPASTKSAWVNYDSAWDDLIVDETSKNSDPDFDGVSYRYFCRSDAQFSHLQSASGGYKVDNNVKECAEDIYNYYKIKRLYYLDSTNNITTLMNDITNQISTGSLTPQDGMYKVRLGYAASIKISNIMSQLKKDYLVCTYVSDGKEGDQYIGFEDSRLYKVTNGTTAIGGTLYSTLSNYKVGNAWTNGSYYNRSLSNQTFYIQTTSGNQVESISYKIGATGQEQQLTMSECLTTVDESENLYLCTLPFTPEEGKEVIIKVTYTTEKMVRLTFSQTNYSGVYGSAINLKVKVEGDGTNHTPRGSFIFYKDSIDNENIIGELDHVQIDNGSALVSINSGKADLSAGTYKVYAQYQGDDYYKSKQVSSTTVIVLKASLRYSPDNGSREFGATNQLTGAYTASDFKYGETAEVISKSPTLTTTAKESSGVGSYPITAANDGVADNYNIIISGTAAKLTVKQAPLNITLRSSITTAVIGDTIRVTATLTNPHVSSLITYLPTAAQTYLYLENTKLGKMSDTGTAGVYTYDYVVGSDATEKFKFSVKTDEITNYLGGTSGTLDVSVKQDTYLVLFDNKGYGIKPESQQITAGSVINKPLDPVDSTMTYQFDGWYTSTNYDTKWSFDTDKITRSMTLYAKWKKAELSNLTGIVVTPNTDWNYDGKDHVVASITGTQAGDRVTYTLNGVSSSEIPTIKNAGTYTLKVKVDRDWYNPYEVLVEIIVNRIDPTLSLTAEVEKKYTGSPVTLGTIRVTGVDGELVSSNTVSYVYYVDEYYTTLTSSKQGATEEGKAPVKAGTYYVKVLFGATGNYKEKVGTTKLIIGKAALIDLSNQLQEVAANQAEQYEYNLSKFIPTNLDFGTVVFSIKAVNDTDHILSNEPVIKDGVLQYAVNHVDSGKKAIITITIQSQNYEDKDANLVISTKNKTAVTITGITTPEVDYSGQPYRYEGTYKVKDTSTNQLASIDLETLYTGTTVKNESYSSTTAPTEAGDYTLILSVPSNNKTYTGSISYQFKIHVKDLVITAEDKMVPIGSDKPEYTATYLGLAQSDTATGVLFTCNYVKNDATNGIAGAYEIVPSGATITNSWNYNVIYKKGTLTVKDIHTITFQLGITGTTNPNPIQASEGSTVTMPAVTAVRDGYDFVGWVDGNNKVYAASELYTMIDRDVTFTAKWRLKVTLAKITAEYSGSGLPVGSEIPTSNIKVTAHYTDGTTEVVSNYTLSSKTVEKEGDNVVTITYNSLTSNILVTGFINNVVRISASYSGSVLAGQSLDNSKLVVTATYEDGSSAVITQGYTLNTYTITPGENILTVKYSEKTATLIVTGIAAEGTAILTFDSQGGSSISRAVVQIGKTYTPESPVRAGYIFKGWYTQALGQGSLITSSTIITGNATYYAYWVEASGAVSRIYASYHGELLSGELNASDFLVMAVYENGLRGMITGFTLSTSTLNVGINIIIVSYDNVTTIVTLTVSSQPRNLTVTLKSSDYVSGYTLTKSDLTVLATLADGTIEEAEDYILSNHTLKLGSNAVTVTYLGTSTTVEVEGKKSCTISFYTKGGNSIKSIQVVSGKIIGSLPTPTKEKSTFEGWYFDEDYTRKCTSTNKITSNVSLYAKWKKNKPYTISSEYMNVQPLGQDSIYIPGAEGVQWGCEDWNIASIDSDGIVTGINQGTTVITGYTADGYELTCIVTVGKEVKKIHVSKTKVTLKTGDVYNIKATVTPSNASTKELTYASTDESVATVNPKGRVITRRKGTCYITIETTDSSHLTKKIKITVK